MKKYYQINTVSKLAKPITPNQAAKKIENRDFIPWYEEAEIAFIADCTEDENQIIDIICDKMEQLNKTVYSKCFYIAPAV